MSKITESANGQNCQVRLPGICNHDPSTVVWAHANAMAAGKGKGLKSPDPLGAYACYNCHMVIDGQMKRPEGMSKDDVLLAFHEAHQRSFLILIEKGLVRF